MTPLPSPLSPTVTPPSTSLGFFCLAGETDLRAQEFLHGGGSETKHGVLLLPGRHLQQRHRSVHQRAGAEDVTSQYVQKPLLTAFTSLSLFPTQTTRTSCSSERTPPASRAAATIFASLHLSPLSTLPPLIHPDRAFPPAFSLWLPHAASADLTDGDGAQINTFALPFLHHSSGLST